MANQNSTTALTIQEEIDHALLTRDLDEAQVNFLLQRTPRSEIKTRKGRGGTSFDYVEIGYVIETLNKVFGFLWSFDVIDKQILDDECVVEGQLTVITPAGQTIRKTQFGGADIERFSTGPKAGRPLSIADTYKGAGSDALKKCASLLGIGLDVYGRDHYGEDGSAQPEPAKSGRGTPTNMPSPDELRATLRGHLTTLRERHWTQERIQAEYDKVVPDGTPSPELSTAQLAKVAKHFDGLVRAPVTANA